MGLLALCYPQVSEDHQQFMDQVRDRYDPVYKDVVRPHFTIVFQVHDIPEVAFSQHIQRVAARHEPFEFVCRYAMLHNDHNSDDWYVFLVPDEGFSRIARLHDELYTDLLAPQLRFDLPYVPHISVARLKDRLACKELVDELNRNGREVAGMVDTISVCAYDGQIVTNLHHFRLGKRAIS